MSYFIFRKNLDNINGTLYKIAKDQSYLNQMNIDLSIYKIIEDSEINFNNVKYGKNVVEKYNGDIITYLVIDNIKFENKESLDKYISIFKNNIQKFLQNNPNSSLYLTWNNYYNQLNSLDLNNITYPLNKSLEEYFNDLNQTSLSPLQLP